MLLVMVFAWGGCGQEQAATAPSLVPPATQALLVGGEDALGQLDFDRALALVDSAEQRTPGLAETAFLQGRIYSEMARYDEADAAYRRVAERRPDYRGVWNNLGNNAFRQQRFEDALAHYRKELSYHPAPIPWHGIGQVYQERGKVDSAAAAFEQALALDSTYAQARFSLSQLYENEGEFEQALLQARHALALAPGNPEARYQVGMLLVRTGRYEAAVPHLQAVTEQWPWHQGAHYNLGQALVRLGRDEEAQPYLGRAEQLRALQAEITEMQKAVRAFPEDPYTHAGLGALLRQAGRYNDALHAYRVALALDPRNVEIQNNMAVLHFIRGDHEAAIRGLERLLRQDPTYVEGWLNLGIVYAKAARTEAARRAWQQALAYQPDNQAAQAYLDRLGDS